jgi:hypothetical protein
MSLLIIAQLLLLRAVDSFKVSRRQPCASAMKIVLAFESTAETHPESNRLA